MWPRRRLQCDVQVVAEVEVKSAGQLDAVPPSALQIPGRLVGDIVTFSRYATRNAPAASAPAVPLLHLRIVRLALHGLELLLQRFHLLLLLLLQRFDLTLVLPLHRLDLLLQPVDLPRRHLRRCRTSRQ
jgi:hypothetical protein